MKLDATVEFYGNPDAWIFKDAVAGKLLATVCGDCGDVRFTVDNPEKLWTKFNQSGRRH